MALGDVKIEFAGIAGAGKAAFAYILSEDDEDLEEVADLVTSGPLHVARAEYIGLYRAAKRASGLFPNVDSLEVESCSRTAIFQLQGDWKARGMEQAFEHCCTALSELCPKRSTRFALVEKEEGGLALALARKALRTAKPHSRKYERA